jgi:alpha-glucosidase
MYLDDGVSDPPGPSTTVTVHATKNTVKISSAGTFRVLQKLAEVTILGITTKPAMISVSGKATTFTYASAQQKVVVSKLSVDLNKCTTIEWK